jgi:hypothetical protein
MNNDLRCSQSPHIVQLLCLLNEVANHSKSLTLSTNRVSETEDLPPPRMAFSSSWNETSGRSIHFVPLFSRMFNPGPLHSNYTCVSYRTVLSLIKAREPKEYDEQMSEERDLTGDNQI